MRPQSRVQIDTIVYWSRLSTARRLTINASFWRCAMERS